MTKSMNYLSTSHSSTPLVFSKTSDMGTIVIASPFNIQKLRIRDINNLGYLTYTIICLSVLLLIEIRIVSIMELFRMQLSLTFVHKCFVELCVYNSGPLKIKHYNDMRCAKRLFGGHDCEG